MTSRLILLLLVSFCTISVLGQDLPSKIRGYKLSREVITINSANTSGSDRNEPTDLTFGDPKVLSVSLSGIEVSVPIEMLFADQSGKIDRLAFHDVRINGIPVEVAEYVEPFAFKKNVKLTLPAPVVIFIPTTTVVRAAWKEVNESKPLWTVTGRVFAFGRYRKFGFYHKRVVPVDFSISIPNPTQN